MEWINLIPTLIKENDVMTIVVTGCICLVGAVIAVVKLLKRRK